MIRLNLLNVGIVDETDAILLVLQAPELAQLLVIETGPLEGQAVALEAEGVRSERPLTHDLTHEMIQALGARVAEVQIGDLDEETFYAKVVLVRAVDGANRMEFDARPSDAIALALRAGAPIYASDAVMDEAGIPVERNGRFEALYEDDPVENGTIH
ncbi:MAG: bifunctional nuclease family protein [Bacillota bacterium]